jgi:hypothetical protein
MVGLTYIGRKLRRSKLGRRILGEPYPCAGASQQSAHARSKNSPHAQAPPARPPAMPITTSSVHRATVVPVSGRHCAVVGYRHAAHPRHHGPAAAP